MLTLVRMQDYVSWAGYRYARLDGSVNRFRRALDIMEVRASTASAAILQPIGSARLGSARLLSTSPIGASGVLHCAVQQAEVEP